ncbi:MAG: tetratricopeptide repeat protein [Armatimonadota bacterium]
MPAPRRIGLDNAVIARLAAPLDRARGKTLRHGETTDIGGTVAIWYTGKTTTPHEQVLTIQPGVADDLPSLLSALAIETGWPGITISPAINPRAFPPEQAVAAWARVWQPRENADLRVIFWWNPQGDFAGNAELRFPDNTTRPLLDARQLAEQLDRFAAQPQTSESPHGLLVAGNRAMDAGAYAAARALYLRAVSDLPHHPEAHRNLALALARLGEWEAASEAMRQAQTLAPTDVVLSQEYLALETDAGIQAVQHGNLACAAEHFLRILANRPLEPTALVNLGNIRLREGRLPEAKAIFHRFLREHPQHAVAEKVRLALLELGDNDV